MAHQISRHVTVDDDRYPGQTAEVIAWDWAATSRTKTTTLLLRGANDQFVVHRHMAPSGNDSVVTVDGNAARALYRMMPMHMVPFGQLCAATYGAVA